MVPKSERFEMRLEPATVDRIDAWRERQGDRPSRAEAIRRLIDVGLSMSASEGFRLTEGEKLTTWLLTEVLKHQKGYTDQKTVDLLHHMRLVLSLTLILFYSNLDSNFYRV
jgi:Arc/MetJ-type ribon-helix-helix transcriptional regulator